LDQKAREQADAVVVAAAQVLRYFCGMRGLASLRVSEQAYEVPSTSEAK